MGFAKKSLVSLMLLAWGARWIQPVRAQQPGNCAPALAENYLYINNVRARILNNGNLFWSGDPFVYEVPKRGGASAIFSASIWVGGLVGGDLRVAAARYRNFHFWPGPLNDDATLPDPNDCTPFDRIFKISRADFQLYEETGEITRDLRDWPFHLGAPVVDGDGIPNNYNLAGGDRPEILGHQTLWWVMNDVGNEHLPEGSRPIGLEVQATVFAAASSVEAIDNSTLYRYRLINRGSKPLEEAYFSVFADPDLGNFDDDYIGSDTTLGIGFFYNADNDDEGRYGYGEAPPAAGITFLQGPLVNDDNRDNDRDGVVDEADERLGMTSFAFYYGGGGVMEDPQTAQDYYNYMKALWKDGRPFTFGGNGRHFSDIPTRFFFPGDPVTGAYWSERNMDNRGTAFAPADRRCITSTGPFTLQPGEAQDVVFAIVWGRGEDHLASINVMREAARTVQEAYRAGFEIEPPAIAPPPTPTLRAPGNNATSQPLNTTLHWQSDETVDGYLLEIATDAAFTTMLNRHLITGGESLKLDTLVKDQTYYWRVRAENEQGYSALSDISTFSTSDVFIQSPGTLLLAEKVPAYVEVTGADGSDPCGPDAHDTFGCDQVGGNLVYLSVNGDSSYYLRAARRSLDRYAPNDYEIRFTPEGSLGYYTNRSEIARVPFEIWDIGPTAPFTENDPSDDVQMIPALWAKKDVPSQFQYGHGWPGDPLDLGWSSTEGFNLQYPLAGKSYQDFADFAAAGALPRRVDQNFLSNMLIDFKQSPLWWVLFFGNPASASYRLEGPAEGTVIRFYTTSAEMTHVIHSAPADGAIGQPADVTLWWQRPPGNWYQQLQVSTTPDFTALIAETDNLLGSQYTLHDLAEDSTYFWRLRLFNLAGIPTPWTSSWSFTVGLGLPIQASEQPTDATLLANYPNPFNPTTTIWFGLAEPGEVRLTIYNMLGQRVATLIDDGLPAGWHKTQWNAQNLSSGVYFYRLETGSRAVTRPMLLLK